MLFIYNSQSDSMGTVSENSNWNFGASIASASKIGVYENIIPEKNSKKNNY